MADARAPIMADLLREVPLFADLPEEPWSCLTALQNGQELRALCGQVVARVGDPARLHVLLEGELELVQNRVKGGTVRTVIGRGGFFGVLALVLGLPSPATARVLVDCRLLWWEEEAFWRVLASCPRLLQRIMQSLAARLWELEVEHGSAEIGLDCQAPQESRQ